VSNNSMTGLSSKGEYEENRPREYCFLCWTMEGLRSSESTANFLKGRHYRNIELCRSITPAEASEENEERTRQCAHGKRSNVRGATALGCWRCATAFRKARSHSTTTERQLLELVLRWYNARCFWSQIEEPEVRRRNREKRRLECASRSS
jgi:hypothetical protein